MSPRRLALLALVFFAARGLLVLAAADRISEPDLAEVKLMALGDRWIATDRLPQPSEALALAREGSNAPHGGYLAVSTVYALLARPGGRPGRYGLLKLAVLLLATLSFAAWVSVAGRLGGATAAAAMAGLLLCAPPALLGASLVAWGSHPEAAALLGPAVWLLFAGRGVGGAALAGALLGLVCGFSVLLAPACAVLALGWSWDGFWEEPPTPWLPRLLALAAAGSLVAGTLLFASQAAEASVTESAGQSPLELLHRARANINPIITKTTHHLLPPRIVGATWAGGDPRVGRTWDRAFGAALLAALLALLPAVLRDGPRRGRTLALLVGVPLVVGAVLVVLGPRRPWVPPRYLLALWPPALLALSLAVGRARGAWRLPAAIAAAAWLLPGLAAQADLLQPGRIPGFRGYEPARYVAAGIGHVGYEEAPAVAAFLDLRAREGLETLGFGLAAGEGGGEALLLDGRPPHLVDPADLLARRQRLLADRHDVDAALVDRNLGWGLAVFASDRRGTWLSVLDRIGAGRADVAFGLGQGLRRSAAGCREAASLLGPDRAAVRAGATASSDAPPCPGL